MFWRKKQWSCIDFWVPDCHRVFSTIAPVLRSPEGLHKSSKLDSWAWRPPVYYKIVHRFSFVKGTLFLSDNGIIFQVGWTGWIPTKQIDMGMSINSGMDRSAVIRTMDRECLRKVPDPYPFVRAHHSIQTVLILLLSPTCYYFSSCYSCC